MGGPVDCVVFAVEFEFQGFLACLKMSTEIPKTPQSPRQQLWLRILFSSSRGFALLLGAFTLLNVLAELRNSGFDANLWWIDLRIVNRSVYRMGMVATATGLFSFAIQPNWAPFRGWLLQGLLGGLMIVSAWNCATFFRLVSSGVIQSRFPVPLSGGVFLILGLILLSVRFRKAISHAGRFDWAVSTVAILIGFVLFPVAQMHCFGMTDYRRQADVIVVFGCRVRADGVASMALSDRVKTGVELYLHGYAPRLVFSGGPGDGEIHETEAMRKIAIDLGVPAAAIETDLLGLNTQATVHNLVGRYQMTRPPRVLAVSHFYHLPRIKLCFRRAGWEVWTVPARESARLYYNERFVLREVAAWWWYYLNPD